MPAQNNDDKSVHSTSTRPSTRPSPRSSSSSESSTSTSTPTVPSDVAAMTSDTSAMSSNVAAATSAALAALASGPAVGPAGMTQQEQIVYEDLIKSSTCYFQGAFPIPLVDPATNKTATCLSGFYCPNNTNTEPIQYCPPSPQCQITRLTGGVCGPQGQYEPIPCPAGTYCPPGGKEKITCPKGSFCPVGSFEPWPCGVGALCPEGSIKRRDYYGMVVLILLDVILIVAFVGLRVWRNRREPRGVRAGRGAQAAGQYQPLQSIEKQNTAYDGHDPMVDPYIKPLTKVQTWKRMVTRKAGVGGYKPKQNRYSVANPHAEDVHLMDLMKKNVDDDDDEEGAQDLKGLVESFQRSIDGKKTGLTFSYQDLGLKLKTGRVLLSGVHGKIERGTMWGVMGPSGAGKTTFMSVLMGKVEKTSGSLWVNGAKKNMKAFKRVIGYVPQDDIVLPELTVRENILHSARIRLPASWSDAQIIQHVDQVIACLSLSHVQHSIVGDAAKRGVSGGQKKRVNIGIELAAAPMALFLDEPTSGLDSTGALQVAKLLQSIARLGVTVVSVIHQPRTEIFDCFDNIALIASGKPVWQGPRVDMLEYFRKQGFHFDPRFNPSDVCMDIISSRGHRHRNFLRENEVPFLIQEWETKQPAFQHPEENASETVALQKSIAKKGAYWWKQIWLCFRRSMLQQYRMASSFFLELVVGSLAGALIGFTIRSSNGHLFQSVYNGPLMILSSWVNVSMLPQISLIAGIAIALSGSPSGVKVFGDERLVYWREAASGHNRLSYYLGKIFSTVFRIIIAALHFTVFFAMLATPVMSFNKLYLCVLLNFYCVYGLASCVSMLVKKEDGPLLAVIVGLVVAVFCGSGPSLAKVREWHLIAIWRACPGTWFAEAIFTENITPFAYLYNIQSAADKTGYRLDQFGLDMAVMFLIGTVYRVLALGGLVGLKRDKQR